MAKKNDPTNPMAGVIKSTPYPSKCMGCGCRDVLHYDGTAWRCRGCRTQLDLPITFHHENQEAVQRVLVAKPGRSSPRPPPAVALAKDEIAGATADNLKALEKKKSRGRR